MRHLFGGLMLVLAAAAPARAWAQTDFYSNVGFIRVTHAWSRATAGKYTDAVGYLTIENGGHADVLVGVSCGGAQQTNMHQTTKTEKKMPDGMKMPTDSMVTLDHVDVPGKSHVVFAPGGLHLMLMDMSFGLRSGDTVTCLMQFKYAGPVETVLTVAAAGATTPPQ